MYLKRQQSRITDAGHSELQRQMTVNLKMPDVKLGDEIYMVEESDDQEKNEKSLKKKNKMNKKAQVMQKLKQDQDNVESKMISEI